MTGAQQAVSRDRNNSVLAPAHRPRHTCPSTQARHGPTRVEAPCSRNDLGIRRVSNHVEQGVVTGAQQVGSRDQSLNFVHRITDGNTLSHIPESGAHVPSTIQIEACYEAMHGRACRICTAANRCAQGRQGVVAKGIYSGTSAAHLNCTPARHGQPSMKAACINNPNNSVRLATTRARCGDRRKRAVSRDEGHLATDLLTARHTHSHTLERGAGVCTQEHGMRTAAPCRNRT